MRSAVSHSVGVVGLLGALIATVLLSSMPVVQGYARVLVMLVLTTIPMVLWSVFVDRVHRNLSTGLDWGLRRPWSQVIPSVLVKWWGLVATWLIIGLAYFAVRYYSQNQFQFYRTGMQWFVPVMLLLSLPYFAWVDRRQLVPQDGYWHCGLFFLGRWSELDWNSLKDHALAWLVKAFFLAFMMSILPNSVYHFTNAQTWSGVVDQFLMVWGHNFELGHQGFVGLKLLPLVSTVIGLVFFVDVLFGSIGYITTLRPLDSHIRSAHPTTMGWLAALSCYPPFTLMGNGGAFDYRQTPEWHVWLADLPLLAVLWAGLLVCLCLFYVWSTMVFGLRFSNLTNRGILTHGPYSIFKHPAYLSKVGFWWMVHLPFLHPLSGWEALRNTTLLLFISFVYWLRAKTEERHLREDPDYRAYETWMQNRRPRWAHAL